MSRCNDEADTLINAVDVANICNALLVARGHDARRVAAGLLVIAGLLVENDVLGKIALAALMAEAISDLLQDIAPDTLPLDVRRLLH